MVKSYNAIPLIFDGNDFHNRLLDSAFNMMEPHYVESGLLLLWGSVVIGSTLEVLPCSVYGEYDKP